MSVLLEILISSLFSLLLSGGENIEPEETKQGSAVIEVALEKELPPCALYEHSI